MWGSNGCDKKKTVVLFEMTTVILVVLSLRLSLNGINIVVVVES